MCQFPSAYLIASPSIPRYSSYEVKWFVFGDFMREGFTAIIEFFKRAAVVVGVHGAGLANIMFAAQCKLLPS